MEPEPLKLHYLVTWILAEKQVDCDRLRDAAGLPVPAGVWFLVAEADSRLFMISLRFRVLSLPVPL